ncbi:hypothetical protein RW1_083_00040 [Rhodococcus wratislaviensis NBRC 100605]|uniref:Uncharacterized protein n=1 Tax=Rhodococcus wratislaviensis NBRC 100605 TaxID=1219028 RepID=X0QCW3_RHOWR|nr:hypothetical protein RW1_083_00040 [Rhodococcus wratislaviensis NBRC 100605]
MDDPGSGRGPDWTFHAPTAGHLALWAIRSPLQSLAKWTTSSHSDTEIITPRPDQVAARCCGSVGALAVDITAPARMEDSRQQRL